MKNNLVSYSIHFVSFLVKYIKVNKIILFGSVVRGDFDEESDIDLFIETNENKNKVEKILSLYEKSEENKKYRLSGINNEIKLKIGKLDEWKSLKRSIISNGLILYGNYKEVPENLNLYLLFNISLEKIPRNKKVKIWRKLYGYTQKIGNKVYKTKGIVDRRIGRGGFMVSVDKSEEVINLLKKEKINYKMKEIWF